ncbi:MAG: hypothetical protein AB7F96_00980 [Beijerinckiaceae bacterium]
MLTSLELIRSILIGAIAAGVVGILAMLGAQSRPNRKGWRAIKAGPMHWTGLGLGTALVILMSYVWLFVGSTRPDAEQQMSILFYLILAFGAGTIILGCQCWLLARRAIFWRGTTIRFTQGGAPQVRAFDDVEALATTMWGRAIVRFRDGTELTLDPHAQGAEELIARLDAMLNGGAEEPA